MPMIMDDQEYNMNDMNDDLFGDTDQIAMPTLNAPQTKDLPRRLDELSASGCCQRIAWSTNGCVAYITPDRYSVKLRVFARDPETGAWDLGKESTLELPAGHESFQIAHLSCSHLGNDMAVVDDAGHLLIFSCHMAVDRVSYSRTEAVQPEAEMDAVVGMHWLAIHPYEAKNHISWSATRSNDTWTFQKSSHQFHDAHHPRDGKASLIYLKRSGELRLRFQQEDSSWQEVATSLGTMVSASEAFTHAAFSSNNDDTLLLAAYDVSGKLHLYRIQTKWNVPQLKQGQQPKPFDKPELQASELCTEDHCFPLQSAVMNGDLTGNAESKVRIPAQLTHLNFLPRTPQQDDGTLPTIQAIFSSPPNFLSLDQTHQNPFSIIVRWEFHHAKQDLLHSSLDKVTSKKKSVNSIPSRDVFHLKRLPDIVMHSVVLEFSSLWYNMILAFCHSDGTIEFRKRATMESIVADFNTDTVTSLAQAGFVFPTTDPSPYIALSPSHCLAACMFPDGTIKLKSMEYSYGSLSSADTDLRHSAALAALVLQSSTAAHQYHSNDDIFSIINSLAISPSRTSEFIDLLFQGLDVNIDCGIDDQAQNHLMLLGRSPFFVKTLSASHLLGLKGNVERTIPSKLAWMILNIKYITQILTTIARMHGQIDKTPLRPEIVPQFMGICRWLMHFMVYLLDDIIALAYYLDDPAHKDDDINTAIQASGHTAILLFLSSFPRMMLKMWSQPLAWFMRTAVNYSGSSPNVPPEVRRVYAPLHQAILELPFDWRQFESLVSEAQHYVRKAYREPRQLAESERNHIERELVLGRIPDLLLPVAKRLLTESIFGKEDGADIGTGNANGSGNANSKPPLADRVDIGKIMFFDTTWLGLSSSKVSKRWSATHIVDVCQKTVIRGVGAQLPPLYSSSSSANSSQNQGRGRSETVTSSNGTKALKESTTQKRLRRCTRCGAYMEDVLQGTPNYANHHVSWLMGVAKHCVCGNSWMLVDDVTASELRDRVRGRKAEGEQEVEKQNEVAASIARGADLNNAFMSFTG